MTSAPARCKQRPLTISNSAIRRCPIVLQSDLSVFAAGCAGGVATELLHWWNLRTQKRWPAYASSSKYWLLTAAMVLVGGAVSWFQLGARAEAMIAFQIGIAAPLLLQKLATATPQPTGSKSLGEGTTRDFFRW